jgi:hypothetical protein
MLELIALIAAASSTVVGYIWSRNFVQRRLTFVESIHTPGIPILVGIGAAVIAAPVAWILPLIGTGTAMVFGAGIGAGVAAGRRGVRQRLRAG